MSKANVGSSKKYIADHLLIVLLFVNVVSYLLKIVLQVYFYFSRFNSLFILVDKICSFNSYKAQNILNFLELLILNISFYHHQ